jgi:hypothetical protein
VRRMHRRRRLPRHRHRCGRAAQLTGGGLHPGSGVYVLGGWGGGLDLCY